MAVFATLVLLGALAPPPAIELRWSAPAGCPDTAELRARTHARLGDDARPGAVVDARVAASTSGYGLTLAITLTDAASVRRELEAPRCEELVDAAALMIAVALDPVQVASSPAVVGVLAAPQLPEPTTITARRTITPRPPIVAGTEPRTRMRTAAPEPFAVALRPSVGVWFGAMPRPAPALGFDVVAPARRAARVELGVLAIPRQRRTLEPDAGAQLWLAVAVLRACFAPAVGRVRPMGCAGVSVGAIGGRGRGTAVTPSPAVDVWASALASAGLGITLVRRLELVVRGEGHIHLRRPGFHVDGVGPVLRSGAASVTAFAGLQAVLP